jgi:hypothetical protein
MNIGTIIHAEQGKSGAGDGWDVNEPRQFFSRIIK